MEAGAAQVIGGEVWVFTGVVEGVAAVLPPPHPMMERNAKKGRTRADRLAVIIAVHSVPTESDA